MKGRKLGRVSEWMKRLEKRRSEGEKERARERERERRRKRVGDEGAFPVRSVEKGDRGGYGVVAWVCGGTGSCREMRERLDRGNGEGSGRGEVQRDGERPTTRYEEVLGSWIERGNTSRSEGERRSEREVSGGCERDDTIEKEQHEREAGVSELEGKRRKRENEME